MVRIKSKLVYEVGINDADYVVCPGPRNRQVWCEFYRKWVGMIERCYSNVYQSKQPTYIGCCVCAEWLTFSNFKSWMEKQDWKGKELDKDILLKGNKIYSPETCCFVPRVINSFIHENDSRRGDHAIGVYIHKANGKLIARCRNPITGKKRVSRYI